MEKFEEMELELITFGASDVIATSGEGNQNGNAGGNGNVGGESGDGDLGDDPID